MAFDRLRQTFCPLKVGSVDGDEDRAAHSPSSSGGGAVAGAAGTAFTSSWANRRRSRQSLPRMMRQVGRKPAAKVISRSTGILMSAWRFPHRLSVTSLQLLLAMIATKAAITTQNRVRRNCIRSPFAGASLVERETEG